MCNFYAWVRKGILDTEQSGVDVSETSRWLKYPCVVRRSCLLLGGMKCYLWRTYIHLIQKINLLWRGTTCHHTQNSNLKSNDLKSCRTSQERGPHKLPSLVTKKKASILRWTVRIKICQSKKGCHASWCLLNRTAVLLYCSRQSIIEQDLRNPKKKLRKQIWRHVKNMLLWQSEITTDSVIQLQNRRAIWYLNDFLSDIVYGLINHDLIDVPLPQIMDLSIQRRDWEHRGGRSEAWRLSSTAAGRVAGATNAATVRLAGRGGCCRTTLGSGERYLHR